MSHSLLLEGSRTQLVNQLVYFDDGLLSFLDEYCPERNSQRALVEKTIAQYSSILESILQNFTTDKLNAYALIGSKVTVQYLDDQSTESYIIVFPANADPERHRISFLSPLGLQLLMAQKNDGYELEVPSGMIPVRIQDIQFYNDGSVE